MSTRSTMNATDAMFHLDAVARSVPEPMFPPDSLNAEVSGILRATRPFLDTDPDWILPNIEGLQQQVSVYDTLLDRIDEIRSEVQRRRDAVHKTVMSYSSMLVPVRRLPVDVLRAVFHETQILQWQNTSIVPPWHDSRLPLSQALDFPQGPWTLSHVCGAWRDVVMSCPQLWSHIVLHFQSPRNATFSPLDHPSPRHTLDAFKAMILRSEQCPLDIVFELDSIYHQDMAEKVFSVILEVSHRWRTLVLDISLDFLERLRGVRGRIPYLESLTLNILNIPQTSRANLPEDIRSVFVDASRLQKITLHGGLGDFIFPLHITHLAAGADNVPNLGAYQSLVECHLGSIERPSQDIPLALPIYLPNIRHLYVSFLGVLEYLRLPFLNDLTIESLYSTPVNAEVQIVNNFIRRSQCSLTRLAFYSVNVGDEVFIQDHLLFMETLVCLEIGTPRYTLDIMPVLASVAFLPNLRHLGLRFFTTPLSWDPLIPTITSLSQNLHSVNIYCPSLDGVERLNKDLAPLQRSGQHFIAVLNEQHQTSSTQFGNFNQSHFDGLVD
ncbi:hypothetical protein EDD85DRAFT_556834 [Armillaria nabsnona]|nr:hypothetical protein EDD85DRAFT_556834 [Armillaria nabsnona]